MNVTAETKVAWLLVYAGWPEREAHSYAPGLVAAFRHGTVEALDRHLARAEPLCGACGRHGIPPNEVAHGTDRGYRWHQRNRHRPEVGDLAVIRNGSRLSKPLALGRTLPEHGRMSAPAPQPAGQETP